MKQNHKILLMISGICFISRIAAAENMRREINLSGNWKFQPGTSEQYAEKDYNDSHWREIWAPKKWESQGYYDMDGYAWYRLHVTIPSSLKNKTLYLKVGKIDDSDKVYLNGRFIGGTGLMGDDRYTEYQTQRAYLIDPEWIQFGRENVIAIKVWDRGGEGGIRDGQLGIYSRPVLNMELDLSGTWRFTIGDRSRFSEMNYDDSNWDEVRVPSFWGDDEYSNRIQFAWYRKTFRLSNIASKDQLLLVLGKIDDSDRVYLNGTLIGITGDMPDSSGPHGDDAWDKDRIYYIPKHLLQKNGNNVLAIRVYNRIMRGGIYEGPIGIVTQTEYKKYMNQEN